MNFRQKLNLEKNKSRNIIFQIKKTYQIMESNDINKLLSKNKISNNDVIRLSTIIKSIDKKSLFNSNFFSIIRQNTILFPTNPNK